MSTRSLTLTRPETSASNSESLNHVPSATNSDTRIMQLTKSLYQTDQQVKFLNLQAEVECLLLQLQSLKQEKFPVDAATEKATHV